MSCICVCYLVLEKCVGCVNGWFGICCMRNFGCGVCGFGVNGGVYCLLCVGVVCGVYMFVWWYVVWCVFVCMV